MPVVPLRETVAFSPEGLPVAVTQEQLDNFHRFAAEKISDGAADLTLRELVDLWEVEHPSDSELRNNVLAVQAAIRDLQSGDRGISLEEHVRELQAKYGTPADE